MNEHPGETSARVTVAEAAEALGVSQHAIRQRISRGTLASERDAGGRVYVYIPPDTEGHLGEVSGETSAGILAEKDARIEELRERVDDLREQLSAEREANRENRRIIMQQAQSLAAIEPAEPRDVGAHGDAGEGAGSTPGDARPGPERGTQRRPSARSLIRRFLQGR